MPVFQLPSHVSLLPNGSERSHTMDPSKPMNNPSLHILKLQCHAPASSHAKLGTGVPPPPATHSVPNA